MMEPRITNWPNTAANPKYVSLDISSMPYIDNLAYSLFSISLAGFLLLYTVSSMYGVYNRRERNFEDHLKSACVPLGLIAAYMFIMGLWGQFTWPLPGSYNILFYDPLISFGIVLIAFALAVKCRLKLEYVGFLGLMVGLMTIAYGAEGYSIGLTQAPVALLLLYFLYGFTGILSFPVSLMADRAPDMRKGRVWHGWKFTLAMFWIFLLLASLLSGFVAVSAISAHLITTP